MVAKLSFEKICEPPWKKVFAIDLFRLIESGTSSRVSGSQGVNDICCSLTVVSPIGENDCTLRHEEYG